MNRIFKAIWNESSGTWVDDGGQDQLVFPAVESASNRGASYRSTDALRKLKPGMNKPQIASLLGRPQFHEGFFGVREWDYVLNVTNDAGALQMVCQLKTVFTSHDEAGNFYRKCGDSVETLTDGKWQKYQATRQDAQTSGQVNAQAATQPSVLVATPLNLEVVQTSSESAK
ncbi:outer membrane protein assembly factor BamE [Caballeronia sp. SEWSISQ10-4 2]|uniref:outer membrane protein assembly factor BamE domain-containing protein n=1 Tax=Caballeronia sp. SEWSISQ10-4 2 TaxID=2937438 RepID=UPI00265663D6|nr:outer membrane protein assembly factor BamE [Caballeronia sp. SEWSISQ10-4 2]MDN7176458.1 outer membrane protein assembly factor BamE [Caballeronia sp. SEWSISQ10-4 2]